MRKSELQGIAKEIHGTRKTQAYWQRKVERLVAEGEASARGWDAEKRAEVMKAREYVGQLEHQIRGMWNICFALGVATVVTDMAVEMMADERKAVA